MLIQEIVDYFETKKEHYLISDGFIKAGYQQKSGGYIAKAKKMGLEINYKKAIPNQKWHFINSYTSEKRGDDVYKHLLVCPELLLWMAEACGIDNNVIKEAEKKAREIIDMGQSRNKAGLMIRKMIPWEMIEGKIKAVNNQNQKFCYRKVDFYDEAYIGGVFLKSEKDKNNKFFYILEEAHKEMKTLVRGIKLFKKAFKENKKNPAEVYGAMILKIRFNRTSPLKKEFWTTNTKEEMVLDQYYRNRQYLKMFDGGRERLYQIMVMPYHYEIEKKKWILSNWLPVLSTITDEELGKIAVMSTKTQVDPSAKDMALYSIEWIKGLEVETWELVETEETKKANIVLN